MKIGTIQSIWRYPVKGMAGESVQHCALDHLGLAGDRTWAVQDIKRQEIQSCKFRPQLLQCTAKTLDHGQVSITFPDGEVLPVEHPTANQKISALVGHDSQLQARRPAEDLDFYRRFKKDNRTWLKELKDTFAREPGEPLPDLDNLPPDMQEFVSILGTFFLVSPFHILTSASLQHMQSLNPDADWHPARFRPNIVIATEPGLQGLAEQDWIDKKIKIGQNIIDCHSPAPRCGAVIRPQSDLPEDKTILRSIVREAEQNLGVYGDILNASEIGVGDPVSLMTS